MNELNFSMCYLMITTIHFIVAMVLVNTQVVQLLINGKTEIVQKTSNLNFTLTVITQNTQSRVKIYMRHNR